MKILILGGLVTQMCLDAKCPDAVPVKMVVKKCRRYANPRAHIRKAGFVCPSQPTTTTEVKKEKVRPGQKKTKRIRG